MEVNVKVAYTGIKEKTCKLTAELLQPVQKEILKLVLSAEWNP